MAQKLSLWDRIRRQPSAETALYNPAKLRIGAVVDLPDADLLGYTCKVRRIIQYRRKGDDQEPDSFFTDYELNCLGTGPDQPNRTLRLRFLPADIPDQEADYTHDVLKMELRDTVGVQDGADELIDMLEKDGKDFRTPAGEEFMRCHNLRKPYVAELTIAQDTDANGHVDESELRRAKIRYWDFSANRDGRDEWMFVECDSSRVVSIFWAEKADLTTEVAITQ